jgi:hypothetical protein
MAEETKTPEQRHWAHAVTEWRKRTGSPKGLPPQHGTPDYEAVAAIYKEWYPNWESKPPKVKKSQQQKIEYHVTALRKLGVIVPTSALPAPAEVQSEEKNAPPAAPAELQAKPDEALRSLVAALLAKLV